jgi:hypothetical protein
VVVTVVVVAYIVIGLVVVVAARIAMVVYWLVVPTYSRKCSSSYGSNRSRSCDMIISIPITSDSSSNPIFVVGTELALEW